MRLQFGCDHPHRALRWQPKLLIQVAGGVAERFKAPVLKTGKGQPFVSSNLTASAIERSTAGVAGRSLHYACGWDATPLRIDSPLFRFRTLRDDLQNCLAEHAASTLRSQK